MGGGRGRILLTRGSIKIRDARHDNDDEDEGLCGMMMRMKSGMRCEECDARDVMSMRMSMKR